MWITRIGIEDEFADPRVVVCHNRQDAEQEAIQLRASYKPQRGVEIFEATIPEILVALGVIDFAGIRHIEREPRLQAPYLKDLLPYASKRAANAIVNAMTRIATMSRRGQMEYWLENGE